MHFPMMRIPIRLKGLLVGLICLLRCAPVAVGLAAQPTFFADNEQSWSDGTSVILADVKTIVRVSPDEPRHRAVFVPRATLSGSFDCGIHPELAVSFWVSYLGAVEQAPKPGKTVIAVVRPVNERWVVPIDAFGFMPEKAKGMAVIDSPADARVTETLKKIQAARAKGRARVEAEAKADAEDEKAAAARRQQ